MRPDENPPAGKGRTPRERAVELVESRAAVGPYAGPYARLERLLDAALDVIAELLPSAPEAGAEAGVDWFTLSREDYARLRRERLDAKVAELQAAGWDVVARRERDKALLERDEARDLLAEAAPEAEGTREVNWKAHLVEQGERLRGLLRDQRASVRIARRYLALEDYAAAEDVLAAVAGDDVDPPPAPEAREGRPHA